MPRRARQLSASSVYHVMLRGVNREAIFLDQDDFKRFIHLLATVRQASGCLILAYCLMPNHVHLVTQTTNEPIGLVMKRLGVRYAGWFNRKYDRVGHLFQDRFKSLPVEDDAYLTTLLRYVWNNPVSAGLVTRAEDYPWSSRRFLATPVPWLDDERLRHLVASSTLQEIATGDHDELLTPNRDVNRLTDQDVAFLIQQTCGVTTGAEFMLLDPGRQSQAIAVLQSNGASLRQSARVTGLSVSAVRRRHARAQRD